MYERYYGLAERPFRLAWNPRYLLLTAAHEDVLTALQYGISSRQGIVVLVGEAGAGKTTLIRAAVASRTTVGRIVCLNNPLLTRREFFQQLVQGFGLGHEAAASKPRFVSEFTRTLQASSRNGSRTALILDDAHALPHEILEEIHFLANIETDDEKQLPIVLSGQPELGARLNEPSLRPLKQRVVLRCTLDPLHIRETAAYIAGRIRAAGGHGAELFTPPAVALIHEASQGLPRTISIICDNALMTAFAIHQRPVGRETVLTVCRTLDLKIPEPKAVPVTAGPSPSSGDYRGQETADGAEFQGEAPPPEVWTETTGQVPYRNGRALFGGLPRLDQDDTAADRDHTTPIQWRSTECAEKLVVSPALAPRVREQYGKLAAWLRQAQVEQGVKVVVLTSALPGEGKTLTATNLALTLSESYGRRVLLVDADLRRPMVHTVLGVSNEKGLSDVLAVDAPLSLSQPTARLWVLTAGGGGGDPMKTLTSDRTRAVVEEARNTFDWVLVDTAPIGLWPDAKVLTSLADGALFVALAGKTAYDVSQRAAETLGPDRILGVVLNGVTDAALPLSYDRDDYASRAH